MAGPIHPLDGPVTTDWHGRREMVRRGMADLKYLPRGRCEWNTTLAAVAYGVRREMGSPDLALWAAMHGCPASARYIELGRKALVLWHGTSARRAERIREVGLFPKKGIWATAKPRLAHSFSRNRGSAYQAGSAMIVLVLDRKDMPVAFEMAREPDTLRFRSPLGPEYIEYILWDDRIDFAGAHRSRRPRPWGTARFKRAHGRWMPRSRPPVRFDDAHTYDSLDGWLDLSVRRIVRTLGSASGIEIFSSLYATVDTGEALPHEAVFDTLDRLCVPASSGRAGVKVFSLRADEP